jgi:hypothetical protein
MIVLSCPEAAQVPRRDYPLKRGGSVCKPPIISYYVDYDIFPALSVLDDRDHSLFAILLLDWPFRFLRINPMLFTAIRSLHRFRHRSTLICASLVPTACFPASRLPQNYTQPLTHGFCSPAFNLWNARWVLLKETWWCLLKHLQTNSPQKGENDPPRPPEGWGSSRNDRQEWPPGSPRFFFLRLSAGRTRRQDPSPLDQW